MLKNADSDMAVTFAEFMDEEFQDQLEALISNLKWPLDVLEAQCLSKRNDKEAVLKMIKKDIAYLPKALRALPLQVKKASSKKKKAIKGLLLKGNKLIYVGRCFAFMTMIKFDKYCESIMSIFPTGDRWGGFFVNSSQIPQKCRLSLQFNTPKVSEMSS